MENKAEKPFRMERNEVQDQRTEPVLILVKMHREGKKMALDILENFCEENCGSKRLQEAYGEWRENWSSRFKKVMEKDPEALKSSRYIYVSNALDYLKWTGQI